MAVTECNIVPCALCKLVDGLGVEYAVRTDIVAFDADVLGVYMVNAVRAQLVNSRYRIAAHPHQMAWIKVHADHRTDCIAQTNECLRIVDHLAAVVLECNLLNAVAFANSTVFFQYGISTSSHCQFRIRVVIGGQLVTIQFGV